MAAVKQHWPAMEYALNGLKGDFDIGMAALQENLSVFEFHNQQEFVVAVAQRSLKCHNNNNSNNKRHKPISSTTKDENNPTTKKNRPN